MKANLLTQLSSIPTKKENRGIYPTLTVVEYKKKLSETIPSIETIKSVDQFKQYLELYKDLGIAQNHLSRYKDKYIKEFACNPNGNGETLKDLLEEGITVIQSTMRQVNETLCSCCQPKTDNINYAATKNYPHLDTIYSKHQIDVMYDNLVQQNWISATSSRKDFISYLMVCNDYIPSGKIRWLKGNAEFTAFIHCIMKGHETAWKTACEIFIKDDGNPFNCQSIKNLWSRNSKYNKTLGKVILSDKLNEQIKNIEKHIIKD